MTSPSRRRSGRQLWPVLVVAGLAAIGLSAVAYAALAPRRAPVVAVATVPRSVAPSRVATLGVLVAKQATEADERLRAPQAEVRDVEATPPVTPKTRPTAPAPPPAPSAFDVSRAMAHIRMLADTIGVRVGGTAGEQRAVDYAAGELRDLGYEVTVQSVRLPNGRTSHNVVAKKAGAKGPIVVLGGHIDSKSPAPGADDNATGVGTLLELARDFAKTSTPADLRFVAFGTEELIGDGNSDHHHFGSRYYLKSLTSGEKGRFAAMVSIDMIGYGSDFRVRTMGIGTRAVADRLLATAKATKTPLGYLRDPGSTGWSDHEPFERAGLPAAWLEWRDNPNAHTSRDTVGRLVPSKVGTSGELVRAWLVSLTSRDLAALVRTR